MKALRDLPLQSMRGLLEAQNLLAVPAVDRPQEPDQAFLQGLQGHLKFGVVRDSRLRALHLRCRALSDFDHQIIHELPQVE